MPRSKPRFAPGLRRNACIRRRGGGGKAISIADLRDLPDWILPAEMPILDAGRKCGKRFAMRNWCGGRTKFQGQSFAKRCQRGLDSDLTTSVAWFIARFIATFIATAFQIASDFFAQRSSSSNRRKLLPAWICSEWLRSRECRKSFPPSAGCWQPH
jgi:hypothetical protein